MPVGANASARVTVSLLHARTSSVAVSDCPTNEALLGFCEGQLDAEALTELEAHLDRCAECRTVVAVGGFDATPPPPEPRPGEVLGRWRLDRRLGSGTGGMIFGARDEQLQREVALKVLFARDDDGQTRGLGEAQAMAQVLHPNVVTLYEVDTIDGWIVLAMELVDGESLEAWLEQPRHWTEIVDVFIGAALGLGAAHAAGVTHGDFKPANVLLGNDGTARVGDFGLSRFAARTQTDPLYATTPELSRSVCELDLGGGTAVSGTPAFMAPEQYAGHPATPASDIYALCIALYRALYRRRPFAGQTPKELAESRALRQAEAPPRSAVPRALWRVVRRGLQHDPQRRYDSVQSLVDALRNIRGRRRRVALVLASSTVVGLAFAAGAVVTEPAPQCADIASTFEQRIAASGIASIRAALSTESERLDPSVVTVFERRLASFRSEWQHEHTLACDAGTPADRSARILSCLDEDLDSLTALVETFATRDDKVTRLSSAIESLPALAHCREPDNWPVPRNAAAMQVRRDFAVAQALFKVGDFDAAAAALQQVRDNPETPRDPRLLVDVLNQQAVTAIVTGDIEGAQARVDEAIEHAWGRRLPTSASKTATLALELASVSRDFESADQWIARAQRSQALVVGNWKHEYDVQASIARTELERGHPEAARVAATRALQVTETAAPNSDRHVRALLLVGNTWMVNREPAKAIATLERALAIAGDSPDVTVVSASVAAADLGQALVNDGQTDRARPLLAQALAGLRPYIGVEDRAAMAMRLVRLDIKDGQPEAALRRLREIPELPPKSRVVPLLHGMRGMAHRELQHHAAAAEAFAAEAAARESEGPTSIGRAIALDNCGAALLTDGRYDEGLESSTAALAIYVGLGKVGHHGRWSAEGHIAACLNELGQSERVITRLEPALAELQTQIEADDAVGASVRYEFGRALMMTGQTKRGATMIREQIAALRALDQSDNADEAAAWLETRSVLSPR